MRLDIPSFASVLPFGSDAGQLADGSPKAIVEFIEGDKLMRLSLIVSAGVTGALAVVLASMAAVLPGSSSRLQYLLNDDILDEGEGGFFESLLFHKIPNLGFYVRHVGGMVQCYVLPCSFFADIDLYDE